MWAWATRLQSSCFSQTCAVATKYHISDGKRDSPTGSLGLALGASRGAGVVMTVTAVLGIPGAYRDQGNHTVMEERCGCGKEGLCQPQNVDDVPEFCCFLRLFSLVRLFCDPMDCTPPGSFVHGILQARILEWVAMPFSRGAS